MSQSGLMLLGLFALIGVGAAMQLIQAVGLAPNMNEDFDLFMYALEEPVRSPPGASTDADVSAH